MRKRIITQGPKVIISETFPGGDRSRYLPGSRENNFLTKLSGSQVVLSTYFMDSGSR